jgi:hypothetical protein
MAIKLNFGEWLPDQPAVSGSLTEATNVYPVVNGYAPFPSPVTLGSAASEALLTTFTGKQGASVSMFASSATKSYKFNTTALTYDNISKTGGYTGLVLDYAQFGSVMITSNGTEKLQSYNLNTSTLFADAAVAAPAAKYVTVVRDFVVAGNVSGFENKLFWSDLNDETNWTPSLTSQADTQILADGGSIQGLTGGEFGLILMEKSIYRMTYIGSPYFFQFDNISRGLGCYEPNSIAQHQNITYFLSDDGFYMCNGQTITGIGNEKVDRFFFKDISTANMSSLSAVSDPIKKLIVWNYKTASGTYAQLIYNWQLQRWSYATAQISSISEVASGTVALESLNAYGTVDTIGISFDSRFWSSSKLLLSGTVGNYVATLDGTSLAGSITTGEVQLEGSRSVVTMVRPIIDNGSSTVAIASRGMLNENINYSTPSVSNLEGRAPLRASGRYHRLKVAPTGAWNYAVGIEIDITPQGVR